MTDHQVAACIERLQQDARRAMKLRQTQELEALRGLLGRIENAQATAAPNTSYSSQGPIANAAQGVGSTEQPRKDLSLDDLLELIGDEIAEIEHALLQIDQSSQYAANLRKKAATLKPYLIP